MKKKLIMGLAMIGASVAVLGGCGGVNPEEKVAEVKNGYNEADFNLYNDKIGSDSLINDKIWVQGWII